MAPRTGRGSSRAWAYLFCASIQARVSGAPWSSSQRYGSTRVTPCSVSFTSSRRVTGGAASSPPAGGGAAAASRRKSAGRTGRIVIDRDAFYQPRAGGASTTGAPGWIDPRPAPLSGYGDSGRRTHEPGSSESDHVVPPARGLRPALHAGRRDEDPELVRGDPRRDGRPPAVPDAGLVRRHDRVVRRRGRSARLLDRAGRLHHVGRDGGRLLPVPPAERFLADPEPRRAGGAVLLHLAAPGRARRRRLERRCAPPSQARGSSRRADRLLGRKARGPDPRGDPRSGPRLIRAVARSVALADADWTVRVDAASSGGPAPGDAIRVDPALRLHPARHRGEVARRRVAREGVDGGRVGGRRIVGGRAVRRRRRRVDEDAAGRPGAALERGGHARGRDEEPAAPGQVKRDALVSHVSLL